MDGYGWLCMRKVGWMDRLMDGNVHGWKNG